jgi:hypothetical protein
MTGIASLGMPDLECHDPRVMGDFYGQVLGWDVILSQDEYVEISDGSTRILFTWVDGYQGAAGPHRRHRSATTCACRRPTWQRRLSAAWSWERPSRISSPAATGGRYLLTQPVIRSA